MIEPFEIKIGQVFVKLEQSTSGSSPSLKMRACKGDATVYGFTIEIPTVVRKDEKA